MPPAPAPSVAPPAARRVIGVDPGSLRCGWGIVEQRGNRHVHIASGVISMSRAPLTERLERIYEELRDHVRTHAPDEASIEGLFYQKNARSALVLGHARAAAMLALRHEALDVTEYEPTVVKKSIIGHGGSTKEQVQRMVERMLGRSFTGALDETDALSIAICHLHQRRHPLLARRTLCSHASPERSWSVASLR
jgi:crossover junction endodeoxyribonuclease RuvC